MRYSKLFARTSKNTPKDADSANARFLEQGGFIHHEMAGVYSFLPLGLKVLRHIQDVIRDEIDAAEGQEILMPALTPKENWTTTGRWDMDVLFRLQGAGDKEYALGATHEEIVTPLVQDYAFSYKDLPVCVYQIQNKYRNEPRAKSGILRGREFGMKDAYSFHTSQDDLDAYYETMKGAYERIFERLGFKKEDTYFTYASGGAFSKYSHEFQVACDVGEDTIHVCDKCRIAVNKEILAEQSNCPQCGNDALVAKRAIEVGNIFKLGTKFTDPFGFKYTDEAGQQKPVIMGCYGIGPTRIMGSLVEVSHDENGIIWPKSVTPFQVHLVSLGTDESVMKEAEKLYSDLTKQGISVLWDDRDERAGAKFKDADLIGIPLRLVISEKTLVEQSVEWKPRAEKEFKLVPLKELAPLIQKFYEA